MSKNDDTRDSGKSTDEVEKARGEDDINQTVYERAPADQLTGKVNERDVAFRLAGIVNAYDSQNDIDPEEYSRVLKEVVDTQLDGNYEEAKGLLSRYGANESIITGVDKIKDSEHSLSQPEFQEEQERGNQITEDEELAKRVDSQERAQAAASGLQGEGIGGSGRGDQHKTEEELDREDYELAQQLQEQEDIKYAQEIQAQDEREQAGVREAEELSPTELDGAERESEEQGISRDEQAGSTPLGGDATTGDTSADEQERESQQEEQKRAEQIRQSLLSQIYRRDSSRPLKSGEPLLVNSEGREQNPREYNLSTITPAVYKASNGRVTRIYKDEKAHVEITNKKMSVGDYKGVRDVDVEVKKGPAVVGLAMTNAAGEKSDNKLTIEFDENGNAIDSIPDLAFAKIESFGKGNPSVAFMEIDGERIVLPMNGEKVTEFLQQISEHKLKEKGIDLEEEFNKSLDSDESNFQRKTDHSSVTSELELNAIREKQPQDKTPEEVAAEYAALIQNKIELEMDAELNNRQEELRESTEQVGHAIKEFEIRHDKDLAGTEKQKQFKEAMAEGEKRAKDHIKKEAKEEYKTAVKDELEGLRDQNVFAVSSATFQQDSAKDKLEHLGVDKEEIKEARQEVSKEVHKDAVAREFGKMLAGHDPVEDKKMQEASRTMLSESGFAEDLFKEFEKETRLGVVSEKVKEAEEKERSGSQPEHSKKDVLKEGAKILDPYIKNKEEKTREQQVEKEIDKYKIRPTTKRRKSEVGLSR